MRRADRTIATGVLFAALAAYVATSPGRIDIVDGQGRYEVAVNWLVEGQPVLWDPFISRFMGVPGKDLLAYSYYGAGGSLFSMPLIALGLLFGAPAETTRFLFSLTSPIFGALTVTLLYVFYRALDVHPRRALFWTSATAFGTLLWPGALSTFDNAQHAFFVLLAVFLGHLGAVRQSRRMAAWGGVAAGMLLAYQEYFVLLIPALAATTYRRSEPRESAARAVAFGVASTIGLVTSLAYNDLRYGSWFETGKTYYAIEGTVVGNPVAGLATLLLSPGKSILLYSPPIVLAFLGFGRLRGERPELAYVLATVSAIVVLLFAQFKFAGGDWCWGPRYLLVLVPLWALAFPFAPMHTRWRRRTAVAILVLGLAVQMLAISVEHQRFFFARGLRPLFWAADSWVYFKQSALLARPGELLSLADGPPESARWFGSIHEPGWVTYAILGPPGNVPPEEVPKWMRQHQIYYLPRPWPFWMWWIEPPLRPINMPVSLAAVTGLVLAGSLRLRRGLRDPEIASDAQG